MSTAGPSEGESVSSWIVRQVASHEGCSPDELSPPLYSSVEVDSLDTLCEFHIENASPLDISFAYLQYSIEIHVDRGSVSVSVRDQTASLGTDNRSSTTNVG